MGVCIVENCEVSATEGWADLQRAGMHSTRILRQYYKGRVRDRAIALHLMHLKQAEHDGWLALVAPEYAGAAKCSRRASTLSRCSRWLPCTPVRGRGAPCEGLPCGARYHPPPPEPERLLLAPPLERLQLLVVRRFRSSLLPQLLL